MECKNLMIVGDNLGCPTYPYLQDVVFPKFSSTKVFLRKFANFDSCIANCEKYLNERIDVLWMSPFLWDFISAEENDGVFSFKPIYDQGYTVLTLVVKVQKAFEKLHKKFPKLTIFLSIPYPVDFIHSKAFAAKTKKECMKDTINLYKQFKELFTALNRIPEINLIYLPDAYFSAKPGIRDMFESCIINNDVEFSTDYTDYFDITEDGLKPTKDLMFQIVILFLTHCRNVIKDMPVEKVEVEKSQPKVENKSNDKHSTLEKNEQFIDHSIKITPRPKVNPLRFGPGGFFAPMHPILIPPQALVPPLVRPPAPPKSLTQDKNDKEVLFNLVKNLASAANNASNKENAVDETKKSIKVAMNYFESKDKIETLKIKGQAYPSYEKLLKQFFEPTWKDLLLKGDVNIALSALHSCYENLREKCPGPGVRIILITTSLELLRMSERSLMALVMRNNLVFNDMGVSGPRILTGTPLDLRMRICHSSRPDISDMSHLSGVIIFGDDVLGRKNNDFKFLIDYIQNNSRKGRVNKVVVSEDASIPADRIVKSLFGNDFYFPRTEIYPAPIEDESIPFGIPPSIPKQSMSDFLTDAIERENGPSTSRGRGRNWQRGGRLGWQGETRPRFPGEFRPRFPGEFRPRFPGEFRPRFQGDWNPRFKYSVYGSSSTEHAPVQSRITIPEKRAYSPGSPTSSPEKEKLTHHSRSSSRHSPERRHLEQKRRNWDSRSSRERELYTKSSHDRLRSPKGRSRDRSPDSRRSRDRRSPDSRRSRDRRSPDSRRSRRSPDSRRFRDSRKRNPHEMSPQRLGSWNKRDSSPERRRNRSPKLDSWNINSQIEKEAESSDFINKYMNRDLKNKLTAPPPPPAIKRVSVEEKIKMLTDLARIPLLSDEKEIYERYNSEFNDFLVPLGKAVEQEYFAEARTKLNEHDNEFKDFQDSPEFHFEYEDKYELFITQYRKLFMGETSPPNVDHTWAKFWAIFINDKKDVAWWKKKKDLQNEFTSRYFVRRNMILDERDRKVEMEKAKIAAERAKKAKNFDPDVKVLKVWGEVKSLTKESKNKNVAQKGNTGRQLTELKPATSTENGAHLNRIRITASGKDYQKLTQDFKNSLGPIINKIESKPAEKTKIVFNLGWTKSQLNFKLRESLEKLRKVTDMIGVMGPALKAVIQKAEKVIIKDPDEALSIFSDDDNQLLLNIAMTKLQPLLERCTEEEKEQYSESIQILKKLSEEAKKAADRVLKKIEADSDVNIGDISQETYGMDTESTFRLIKREFQYQKNREPAREELDAIFKQVSEIHFNIAVGSI